MQGTTDNREDLNRSHDQGNQDRNQGDVQIVVEFAHRFDEGPTICSKHQDTISGIEQAHTCCEQHGEDEDEGNRKTFASFYRGNAQECNLGRSVEAKTEEQSNEVHFPALIDHLEQRSEETTQ